MKLYIAEKPSLARALATALPQSKGARGKEEGMITLANGDVVSWCIGHVLELAEPEHYNPEFKKWRLEHLPIQPAQWQYQPKPKTRKQLNILLKLIKQASSIVHVGDPDREGQLLVDEVLNYAGVPKTQKPVERCLINDLNTSAIAKALQQLRDNRDFAALSSSALARSRADWLYGINMTRLCSLKGQQQGFKGVLSVGRVQTPVLGLVVARDREIEAFVSKPFYEVWAKLQTESGESFMAKWQPSAACQQYCDEEGRLLSRPLAENVAKRITGQPAQVARVDKQQKQQAAPLPYNLSSLQVDASKRFGMAAKAVLDTCQALYERHKLITYPRSDSRYLPEGHFAEAKAVSTAIANNCNALAGYCGQANFRQKSKAWNDKKVTAHHAIIPTQRQLKTAALSSDEQKVYELIARQYLIQFFPAHVFDETRVQVKIETGDFIAKAKVIVEEGWKVLFPKTSSHDKDDATVYLPRLEKGQPLQCEKGEIRDKQTSPPKHFTDATLIAAMTGIARFVKNSDLKKILKETDGLGTEATRASILDLLVQRGFLKRQGKAMLSTDAGRALIDSLPEQATLPDMTAHWESQLDDICHKQGTYQNFMGNLEQQLPNLMAQVEGSKFLGVKSASGFKKKSYKRSAKAGTKNANKKSYAKSRSARKVG